MTTWEKNLRVIVAHGPHAGAPGRLLRDLGRGEWLVKFDHRFAGTAVAVKDLSVERAFSAAEIAATASALKTGPLTEEWPR